MRISVQQRSIVTQKIYIKSVYKSFDMSSSAFAALSTLFRYGDGLVTGIMYCNMLISERAFRRAF